MKILPLIIAIFVGVLVVAYGSVDYIAEWRSVAIKAKVDGESIDIRATTDGSQLLSLSIIWEGKLMSVPDDVLSGITNPRINSIKILHGVYAEADDEVGCKYVSVGMDFGDIHYYEKVHGRPIYSSSLITFTKMGYKRSLIWPDQNGNTNDVEREYDEYGFDKYTEGSGVSPE